MVEVYVLWGKSEEKKVYYVEKQQFRKNSNELALAVARFDELKRIALKIGYSIEEKVKANYLDSEKKDITLTR